MTIQGAFELPDRKVDFSFNGSLLITAAAENAGIMLNTRCAGKGSCGGCAVDLLAGRFALNGETFTIEPGARRRVLGCRTAILEGPCRIAVPARSLVQTGMQVLDSFVMPASLNLKPLVRKIHLTLANPTLDDSVGDFERIVRALRADHGFGPIRPTLETLQQLPDLLTGAGYDVTVTVAENYGLWEMIRVEPGDTAGALYALAVDIGTTTVVSALIDLNTARLVDSASSYNQQVQRCDDVASRIIYADDPARLKDLQRLIIDETLNRHIRTLCDANGITPHDIARAVVSGNSVMTHLLLGVNPRNMGGIPFQPGASDPGTFRARSLGLAINPTGFVDVIPSISAYVGGDITSDIHLVGMIDNPKLTMVIDVGTNAEIALGDRTGILATATPAGPAYEGAGISCGLRACAGAIEHITIAPGDFAIACTVIGGDRQKPAGV